MPNRRCRGCAGPMFVPRAADAERLPDGWRAEGLCPTCVLEGIPSRDPALVAARLERSHLPAALHDLRLAQLRALDDQPELRSALARWGAGELPGLFLHGDVGRGKTYMAAAAARELMEHRLTHFVSATGLLAALRLDFRDRAYREAVGVLQGLRPLVLDDLGQENPSDAAREALHAAIDQRHVRAVPVLITSNLMPSELGERYGAWLPSRIALMERHRARGGDLRLKGALTP